MSKRDRVLQLLVEAGDRGVTTAEFLEARCGSRFGARVQELRCEGFVIDVRRVRDGSYQYTLCREAGRAVREPEAQEARDPVLFVPPALEAALHDWDGGRR